MSRVECCHLSCHRSFKSKDSMMQHYRDRHSSSAVAAPHNQNKYPCLHCDRSFTTKGGLEEHIRVVHKLDQLDASAAALQNNHASASQYNDHADKLDVQVMEGAVACNDCGKLFRSTDFLHQHQWDSANHTRVCLSPTPTSGVHACSQCRAHFLSAYDLEQHFMDRHPISEVSRSGEEGMWQKVEERFISAWMKPDIELYEVHRIFKVYNTGWRRKYFEQYRKELKKEIASKKFVKENIDRELRKKVLQDGNEMERYHGTTVECFIGQPASTVGADTEMNASLCASLDCGLCRILQSGFKKRKCKEEKFQRFGKGIYTSSISSKASAYVRSRNDVVKENYKVMIACKVLAGHPYHSKHNSQHLEGPPMGFHSVQGDPGIALNYEELVVYDDRAILPAFIILYSSSD